MTPGIPQAAYSASDSSAEAEDQLSPLEGEIVDYGVRLAQAFSLPKSVGQIFGLLFASPDPLCLDQVVSRLGISKGSASSGLNTLQRLSAVKTVYLNQDRRTYYAPELSLRRLIQGIIQETIVPHLRDSKTRIRELENLLATLPREDRDLLQPRIKALQTWQSKASTLLPFLNLFLGKPLREKSNRPESPGTSHDD